MMKQLLLATIAGAALLVSPWLACAATNLSTFAPSGPPICTLTGSDPSYNSGTASTTIPAAVGDIITISLAITNGSFSPASNIVNVNGVYVWGVTFPVQVTADVAGSWTITYVSPGCLGSQMVITAH